MSRHAHHATALAPRTFDPGRPVENPDVDGHDLCTYGPLVLPAHVCVRCGSREPGGTVLTSAVVYTNPWIYLTVLISLLITILAYLVTRKVIQVQYYLCPSCADRRKIRTVTAGIVTALSVVGFFAILGANGAMASLFLPAMGMMFASSMAWLIVSAPPLRAVGHDNGRFRLRGAAPRFLDAIDRLQLPHHQDVAPRDGSDGW